MLAARLVSRAQDGVLHRADDVERLLVAEPPLPRAAGQFTGGPGVGHVVVAAAGGVELREDPLERRGAEPAHRLGGELQLAARAVEVPLPLELGLHLPQRREVVDGGPAQRPLEQLLVDVGERGARVALGELVGQRLEVGELRDGGGGVTHAQRLLAVGHLAAPAPREVGAGLAQRVAQVGHLAGQPHVLHGLGHEVGELGPLLR